MRIGDAMRNEKSVRRITNHIEDQKIKRVTDQASGATLDVSYARLISVSIRFHPQPPQQHTCAKKLNHAINAERFEQQTFGSPAKQERRRPFDRHPT